MATDLTGATLDLQPTLDALRARRAARETIDVATMTMVLFVEEAKVAAAARDRVHALAVRHPARVIVLDGTQAGERPQLVDDCTAHASCPAARGEWIEVGVRDVEADILHSAVTALALPEAPVVLLWLAAGASADARLAALLPLARTTVFASAALTDDTSQLREVLRLARAHAAAVLCDVAYLRLHPWQEAIAQFFDRPDAASELHALDNVEIGCSSEPEAYYLLGWLASRLAWVPASPTTFRNQRGATVAFTLARENCAHALDRVELRSARTTFAAKACDGDAPAITLTVSGGGRHPDRARPIAKSGVAELIERAIFTGKDDRVFRETLACVGEIFARMKE